MKLKLQQIQGYVFPSYGVKNYYLNILQLTKISFCKPTNAVSSTSDDGEFNLGNNLINVLYFDLVVFLIQLTKKMESEIK